MKKYTEEDIKDALFALMNDLGIKHMPAKKTVESVKKINFVDVHGKDRTITGIGLSRAIMDSWGYYQTAKTLKLQMPEPSEFYAIETMTENELQALMDEIANCSPRIKRLKSIETTIMAFENLDLRIMPQAGKVRIIAKDHEKTICDTEDNSIIETIFKIHKNLIDQEPMHNDLYLDEDNHLWVIGEALQAYTGVCVGDLAAYCKELDIVESLTRFSHRRKQRIFALPIKERGKL